MLSRSLSSLLAVLLFLTAAEAGRFSEYAHRKGYGPDLRPNGFLMDESNAAATNTTFRFLNNATQPFQVNALPDIPFDVGEMYAGLMPIHNGDPSRSLYFVFQPKLGDPVDELTIWLNGGPGCSSLEGFLQENGRFIWGWGQYSPMINPYSWVNLTNMLWVEQPVGTGFTQGKPQASGEYDIAYDFIDFLMNFETTFGIKNFKIYVTGESYAGRYVPYIASVMLDRHDKTHYNISGALMYDPVIGSYVYAQQQVPLVPFIVQNNNVLGLNDSFLSHLKGLDSSCGYADYRNKYLSFPPPGNQPAKFFNYSTSSDQACDLWGFANNAALLANPCANVYQIATYCPLPSDPLGFPTDLIYSYPGLPVYFNRADVKAAMHAPPNTTWSECNGPVFISYSGGPEDEGDFSPDPIQFILPQVIENTHRVLIANADLDMEIITNGTLLAIQNMTWGGKLGFQNQPNRSIVIELPDLQYGDTFASNGMPGMDNPQGMMGIQHFERGLMWAETWMSGHMQPQFQPRSSYRHLQWLLGHINEL
ncbi:alpha/beta-hydrolase [Mollisia scopiformis]|uniref:Carboxypeptidase n=1 Tax=Mollisia scopiformis TaxID=149040 RepID=A0A194XLV4_MOLSC|nr:alpha/beta-hydrolase [Mollisia scopiformis]KUJ21116.1 alpha/beta-hydrolase [Mollisia scopiformis]